ncbi:Mur ligase family protein [Methanosphaera cuniculi]|uniref:Mur ligase family protein n=1 Tax=Methanosphaera cuniculi TaxID=1077256 RepID=UPI0026DCA7FF|nr:Mur ligase family protein [Methanosphaera cuniculi]
MAKTLKYKIAKSIGKLTYKGLKYLPTGGKAYSGYMYLKINGVDNLNTLVNDQIKIGSILITGTNGKTTTTTMIIDLFSRDFNVTKSVDNNTIYALTTALLSKSADIGIFEYGIRDIKHGQPHIVQKQVQPMCVVYTNISREHTQVLGVKNSFKDYIKAKTLLSKDMQDGIVIVNADDPNTTYIGNNKEDNCTVIYYGFDVDNISDKSIGEVLCPNCDKPLTYTHNFMNQRGIYECDCGFKRPEPDIKVTHIDITDTQMNITIEGNVYNVNTQSKIPINVDLTLPPFGIYNIYNVLASATTYACYSETPDEINEKLASYYNNLTFNILPPGRFEIIDYQNKKVGLGQGDNGDALNANANLFLQEIKSKPYEFIYSTPDVNEEEIFKDHLEVIKNHNPDFITVIPGRVSVDIARSYYEQMKKEGLNCTFYPIEYDFEKRINEIIKLTQKSEYDNVLITGCGEEQAVWDDVKNKLKNEL